MVYHDLPGQLPTMSTDLLLALTLLALLLTIAGQA